jgi:uncharacterized repeat protein (TIGR03803 family)
MRHEQLLRTVSRILMIATVTLILANRAWGRVEYATLYAFSGGPDGNFPPGNFPSALIFDGAGNLYGTTFLGGPLGYGVVFELTPDASGTWTESVLYEFMGGHDGAYPLSSLIFYGAGNLYGSTEGGGDPDHCTVGFLNGCGVIFQLAPNSNGTWTERALYQFTGANDGAFPASSLIFDGAGNLYGTTQEGGTEIFGVAFELSPSTGSWRETVLRNFGSKNALPGSLIFDAAGNLYGTSAGIATPGVAFELTPTSNGGWKYDELYQFKPGKDGVHPQAVLIFDPTGGLFGTNGSGGAYKHGNVFRLTPNPKGSWTEHVLHQFQGGTLGAQPRAGLARDAAGNLYGTTYYGGNVSNCRSGCGVAFELTPTSNGGWKEIVLHTFLDHPGAHPAAGLVLDATGNLYGTSAGDSTTTFGSVFEIAP